MKSIFCKSFNTVIFFILCGFFVVFSINAATKKKIIVVNGVKENVRENVIKSLNEFQKSKLLSTIPPRELKKLVLKAMQPFGYFKPSMIIENNEESRLAIKILPGPLTRIRELNFKLEGNGATHPKLIKLIKTFPLQIGEPLSTEKYKSFKQSLINEAEQLGYIHASFSTAKILVDVDASTAKIDLIFDTGALYRFGTVQFDNTSINSKLLHRFVSFKPGEPYSTNKLTTFNNRLSDSGYFRSVVAKPIISDNEIIPVVVNLEPIPKYSYSLGGGYGTDTGVRGRAGLHVIPVNCLGHRFNALAQGSISQNALQAQYLIPGENPIIEHYNLIGNFSNLNYTSGDSNALLLSASYDRRFHFLNSTFSINTLYEKFHYFFQPDEKKFVLYPKLSLTFKQKEALLFSPSGYNITVNGLGASQALASNINFFQTSVDAKAAYFWEKIGLRVYGHTLLGYTGIKNISTLPLSLALFLGGTDNLKGYAFNSIGQGRKIVYAGVELQKETIKDVYLIGFYDSGDVYEPTPRVMQQDLGIALMWVSPLGPIKMGIAKPINRPFSRTTSPRFFLSMGPDL